MKSLFSVVWAFVCLGCVADKVNNTVMEDADDEIEVPHPIVHQNLQDEDPPAEYDGLCGLFREGSFTVKINDELVIIPVFVACNPNYVDLGYPLPLRGINE